MNIIFTLRQLKKKLSYKGFYKMICELLELIGVCIRKSREKTLKILVIALRINSNYSFNSFDPVVSELYCKISQAN